MPTIPAKRTRISAAKPLPDRVAANPPNAIPNFGQLKTACNSAVFLHELGCSIFRDSLSEMQIAKRLTILWLLCATGVLAQGAQQSTARPDVFLVTIDTLRADHVHCYGYAPIQTPALDGLAKDGILFAQAFTPSPITNSSHVSILTGLL